MRRIACILCLALITVMVLFSVSCKDRSDEEPDGYLDPSEWEDDGDTDDGKSDGDTEGEKESPVRGDAANSGDKVILPEMSFGN